MKKNTSNNSLLLKISFLLLITILINQVEISNTRFYHSHQTVDTELVYAMEEDCTKLNPLLDNEAEQHISCGEIITTQFNYDFYLKYIHSILFHKFHYLTDLNLKIKTKSFRLIFLNAKIPENIYIPVS